jgi:hypothetical protein
MKPDDVAFHELYPAPVCDGPTCMRRQLQLLGNFSFHTLIYQCRTCLQVVRLDLSVRVGDKLSDVSPPPDVDAIDTTP